MTEKKWRTTIRETEPPVKALLNTIERRGDYTLVKTSFDMLENTELLYTTHLIDPHLVTRSDGTPYTTLTPEDGTAYQEERKKLFETHVCAPHQTDGLPLEWQQADFHKQIKAKVQDALKKVAESDVVVFTGGRDVDPRLFGNETHEKTNPYSIFDARDIVEGYMLMAAIAQGKTIHATCRGFQLVTGMMMKIFSDAPPAICQHLPEEIKNHKKLKKHREPGAPAPDHHQRQPQKGETPKALAQILSHDPRWESTLLHATSLDELSKMPGIKDVMKYAHGVRIEQGGMLWDSLCAALLMAGGEKIGNPRSPIRIKIKKAVSYILGRLTSSHHQAFLYLKGDTEAEEKMKKALEDAGGEITAYSDDRRDGKVQIIEGTKFSKVIDETAMARINQELERWNTMLGLDIEPFKLKQEPGKPLPRCDIPHATQFHPEVNRAGIGPIIPRLVERFALAKRRAYENGKDLGGYDSWRIDPNIVLEEELGIAPRNPDTARRL